MLDLPVLGIPALFVAGLGASAHCALMCGPLASAAAWQRGSLIGRAEAHAWLHGGRVLGYAALGGVAGGLGAGLVAWLPSTWGGSAARLLAALAMLATARVLWRRPASCCPPRLSTPVDHWPRTSCLLRGIAWAALPCGLLYSTLALVALQGSTVFGALAMAGFGLGTAPPIAMLALALSRSRDSLGLRRGARRVAAGLLVLTATASLVSLLLHEGAGPVGAWCHLALAAP